METLYYSQMKSPIGQLWIAVSKNGLVMIEFEGREFPPVKFDKNVSWVISEEKTAKVKKQLQQYFDGHRTEFDLPLDPRIGTDFQRKCWDLVAKIPYGETRSYQELAKELKSPNASRAVGGANGANPIPIVVPCHRVINSDGHLGGYGGGLDKKEQLLSLERALPGTGPLFFKAPKSKSAKVGV
ncbi:methylated-DNA--protein-cysteine methyltransferase [Candidatus Koribacter versatilis Ellin345]|uniref:Methylated-DNA--protein-cysteine methyltransferase n=1 Tax=Koribacter versatilis (strain Ellin345) TaxID=204669 RepID=Q1IV22_KORVE|nr:methylated-DNA--[protein]-cysteine S-methyltransferase [Candidatus Koribacter versatilis]ABF39278.1 methylated-DNA--protein-cysteine methyltransferase [Candidatus Koribacter versatilis Ellin345]